MNGARRLDEPEAASRAPFNAQWFHRESAAKKAALFLLQLTRPEIG
jgi:hypothetical protein